MPVVDLEEVLTRALSQAACEVAGHDEEEAMECVNRWVDIATADLATEILKGRITLAANFVRGSEMLQ